MYDINSESIILMSHLHVKNGGYVTIQSKKWSVRITRKRQCVYKHSAYVSVLSHGYFMWLYQ